MLAAISIVGVDQGPGARSTLAGSRFEDDLAEPFDLVHRAGADPLIGFVVAGRYRIIERLGRGGMGVVYKVEHTDLGKLMAIELLSGELGNERPVVRRFKREALLASRLSHPNTVQVFDFGTADGLAYLLMGLVHGHDLSWVLAHEGHLRYDRVARILIQVCSSLAEAHGLGIVHRDVKPGNIMVSRAPDGEDVAKVLDFGLAKLREAPEVNEMTGGGAVVGTPLYMSLEQILGRPVDGRTDIYALGAVMYRVLTGHPPFQNGAGANVLARHLSEDPVPPHERRPDLQIPVRASEIVLRALRKKPADRFERVEQMQAELLTLLEDGDPGPGMALLNAQRLRLVHEQIVRTAGIDEDEPRHAALPPVQKKAIATRDEVEAFKRKLERQKWIAIAVGVLIAGTGAGLAVREWQRVASSPRFDGVEHEPNNQSSQANVVPFGASVSGLIGKRLDAQRSDRDFYSVTMPDQTTLVSIRVTALPNMATCTVLYRRGDESASARFCVGRAGRDLLVPGYRIEPGTWLLALLQDRERYGMPEPPGVVENVSDSYALSVLASKPSAGWEEEPNDEVRAATPVDAGGSVQGTLAWARDEDVVCVRGQQGPGKLRWVVRDSEERVRERGSVLEVTALSEPSGRGPIRVHGPFATGGTRVPSDEVSPWRSDPWDAPGSSANTCLRLRLVDDPWTQAPPQPPVGDEVWNVGVERVASE